MNFKHRRQRNKLNLEIGNVIPAQAGTSLRYRDF